VVAGGQPGPAGQLRRPVEPIDVADLGDEHRGYGRPDSGDGLDRLVAGVVAQPASSQLDEQLHLEVQCLDQAQRESTRARATGASLTWLSCCWPCTPNRPLIVTGTPAAASTPCTWHFSLKWMQYRPGLLDGFLAALGSTSAFPTPTLN
jgi:hypothetical protein